MVLPSVLSAFRVLVIPEALLRSRHECGASVSCSRKSASPTNLDAHLRAGEQYQPPFASLIHSPRCRPWSLDATLCLTAIRCGSRVGRAHKSGSETVAGGPERESRATGAVGLTVVGTVHMRGFQSDYLFRWRFGAGSGQLADIVAAGRRPRARGFESSTLAFQQDFMWRTATAIRSSIVLLERLAEHFSIPLPANFKATLRKR